MIYDQIFKRILFQTDPEKAHELAMEFAVKTQNSAVLKRLATAVYGENDAGLEQEIMGLRFPNPVGLAAGFDKNGLAPVAMQALGFGFMEVGSITAQPSAGNPKPRAFRLPDDRSLINRMGLNNDGSDAIIDRLKNHQLDIPLGVNIAKTNDRNIQGDAALQDYVYSYKKAQETADYITVNISCPNTGEGKTFEEPAALKDLLDALQPQKSGIPTLIKITVDIEKPALEKLIQISEDHEVAGYVATNTSSERKNLSTGEIVLRQIGNGGLSGRAIRSRSTQVVRWVREIAGEKPVIIGVGGIDHPDAAIEKIQAGANLIQLYTGLIYEGPALISRIKKRLKAASIE